MKPSYPPPSRKREKERGREGKRESEIGGREQEKREREGGEEERERRGRERKAVTNSYKDLPCYVALA